MASFKKDKNTSLILFSKRFSIVIINFLKFCFRYQFFLQLKQDIRRGKLACVFENLVKLAAYALQCKFPFRGCKIFLNR